MELLWIDICWIPLVYIEKRQEAVCRRSKAHGGRINVAETFVVHL